jgi:hypothetical protein
VHITCPTRFGPHGEMITELTCWLPREARETGRTPGYLCRCAHLPGSEVGVYSHLPCRQHPPWPGTGPRTISLPTGLHGSSTVWWLGRPICRPGSQFSFCFLYILHFIVKYLPHVKMWNFLKQICNTATNNCVASRIFLSYFKKVKKIKLLGMALLGRPERSFF